MSVQLATSRLISRSWKDSNSKPFYLLNSNTEVMRYFPHCLTREQSDALAHKFQRIIETQGWGFGAVELKQGGGFYWLHRITCSAQSIYIFALYQNRLAT
ncbi:GNAT family N-acetyltransferase [Acinetobacter sp. TSRC1-2]